jgi:hypothetical protein
MDNGVALAERAQRSSLDSVRGELLQGVASSEADLVRVARLGLLVALVTRGMERLSKAGLAALGHDARVDEAVGGRDRVLRVRTLAAAAKGRGRDAARPLLERAEREAFSEPSLTDRGVLVAVVVDALGQVDRGEAARLAHRLPAGVARVRALVAAAALSEALVEAEALASGETREAALATALEALAKSDPHDLIKRGLVQKLSAAPHRDRVLVPLVIATKGVLLAHKIGDPVLRAEALARMGEWDEADDVVKALTDATRLAMVYERLAAAAADGGEAARATAHRGNADAQYERLAPLDRARVLREGAAVASDDVRALDALTRAASLDPSNLREIRVHLARLALARPSGPRVRDALVAAASCSDACAEIYPDFVGALASAFGDHVPEVVEAAVDGLDWAERTAMAMLHASPIAAGSSPSSRGPASPPPPLTAQAARSLDSLSWDHSQSLPSPPKAAPSEPHTPRPPPMDDIEDESDMTSIMGPEQRRMLREASQRGDDAMREAAKRIQAEREAEDRRAAEARETARSIEAALPAEAVAGDSVHPAVAPIAVLVAPAATALAPTAPAQKPTVPAKKPTAAVPFWTYAAVLLLVAAVLAIALRVFLK